MTKSKICMLPVIPRRNKRGLLLDLACGTGSLAVRLSEKGYSVIGTDMSPEMLSVAQQKAAVKMPTYSSCARI